MPSRKRASASTRIRSINRGIGPAVERHGGRSCRDHSHGDPQKLVDRRKSSRREHGAAQSKREGKDGVLPLDHLQRYAQVMQNGHGSIVKQMGLGLDLKVLGLRQPSAVLAEVSARGNGPWGGPTLALT